MDRAVAFSSSSLPFPPFGDSGSFVVSFLRLANPIIYRPRYFIATRATLIRGIERRFAPIFHPIPPFLGQQIGFPTD